MKVPQICREYKFAHFCPCRTGFSLSEGFPKPDQHRFVLAEKSIRDLIEEYVVPPALWYLQKTRNPRLASWAIDMSWLWHWAYFFRPPSSFFFILHPCPNAPPRACKRRGYRECIHRVRSPRLAWWAIDMSWLWHWARSNSSTNRQPNHAPVKGAATGNAYIAFVAHDLRRWLLTCRGSATGVISSVPIHPFFSSFILARTSWLRNWSHFFRPHSSFFFILHPCPDSARGTKC
jgi:hypothetical protein